MKLRQKIMISRFALFLFLLSVPAFAADPLEITVPNAENGQVSMKKTPQLGVFAINVSTNNEPVVFISIEVEKKGSDGKFRNARTDIQCECDAKCNKPSVKLKKGEAFVGVWDYRENNCATAAPGIYRFVVTGRYLEAVAGYEYYGVSKEFTLTN